MERIKIRPRDRSAFEPSAKRLEHVPPEEIRAALEMVVRSSFSIDQDEAISQVLDLLGFQRATSGAVDVLQQQITVCLKRSMIRRDGRTLSPV